MILEVLFVVFMALWGVSLLPAAAPYAGSRSILAWVSVLVLGLYLFAPALRG